MMRHQARITGMCIDKQKQTRLPQAKYQNHTEIINKKTLRKMNMDLSLHAPIADKIISRFQLNRSNRQLVKGALHFH
jgi:hypothetical protein